MNSAYGLPYAFCADGSSILFYDSKVKKNLSFEEELAGLREALFDKKKVPQFSRPCD